MYRNVLVLYLTFSLAACTFGKSVGQSEASRATITVNASLFTPLTKAKSIGVNVEASFIPDDYWAANGKFILETLTGTGIKVARWGYNMWNWDWEFNRPINSDSFWIPKNAFKLQSTSASSTLELHEFLDYCRDYRVVPIVMMPCEEALEAINWDKLINISIRMATWIKSNYSFDSIFLELGNEPWFKGVTKEDYVAYIKEIYPIIKNMGNNFKVVAATHTGLWTDYVIKNASGFYDALDYHPYIKMPNLWDGYYKTDTDFGGSMMPVKPGVINIVGETNVLWPDWENFPNNYESCLPQIEHYFNTINSNTCDYILTWPSHFTTNTDNPNDATGMFNYNQWEKHNKTVRLNSNILSTRFVNEAVLNRQVSSVSSDRKIKTYAYSDKNNNINLAVINKRNVSVTVKIKLSSYYGFVNAMFIKAISLMDKNPQYVNLIPGRSTAGRVHTNTLPPRSASLFSFYNDSSHSAPGNFSLIDPENLAVGVSTMKNFKWTSASDAKNYRIIVSKKKSLSDPVIDMDIGNVTHFQWTGDLSYGTKYYWKVVASNKEGSITSDGGCNSFVTSKRIEKFTHQ